jgi:hypothetical protein
LSSRFRWIGEGWWRTYVFEHVSVCQCRGPARVPLDACRP